MIKSLKDSCGFSTLGFATLKVPVGLLLVGFMAISWAQATIIYVSGDVSGTWSVDTVMVTGEIRVPDAQALTIQPGVEVIFQGNYPFVVEGRLDAVGLPSDSILFTAASSLVGWGGLRFINAHIDSRLEFCRFERGRAEGSTWEDGCGGAVYLYGTIEAIKHCSFVDNRSQREGGAIYIWGATPEFSYNLFTQNLSLNTLPNATGHAICMGNCEGLVLDQVTIAGNGSGSGYSLFVFAGTTLVMTNSILWDTYSFAPTIGEIEYNNINPAGVPNPDTLNIYGTGNLSSNPYFVNLAGADLRVQTYSRTIDAASPSAPWTSEQAPSGGRANMGAYGNSLKATIALPLLSFSPDTLNTAAPDTFDFGTQRIGTMDSTNLVLHNVGALPLEIYGLNFSDEHFSSNFADLYDSLAGALLVPAHGDTTVKLTFTPQIVDSVFGYMSLDDNDATSDPSVPLMGVGLNPAIQLLPVELNFDSLTVGMTDTMTFAITDTGQNVGGIESYLAIEVHGSSDNFSIRDAQNNVTFYDTISVGDTIYYQVLFTPMALLSFAENLLIQSNAGPAYLHCTGTGSQPAIAPQDLANDSLYFGVLSIGQDSTRAISLTNTGGIDLILSDFVLFDSVAYSYAFDTTQSHIAPGDSVTISISFHPDSAGTYNGTLQIQTNVPTGFEAGEWNYLNLNIHLFGTGTSQPNWRTGAVYGTWQASPLPYAIVGDAYVPADSQLTIESGVQVLFEGNFKFTIHGTLQALGATAHAIQFTTIDSDSVWGGMTFLQGSSASLLRNCDFYRGEDSLGGVVRVESSAPTFDQCYFFNNSADRGGAMALLTGSQPTLTGCHFYDNSADFGGALFADWFAIPQIGSCEFHNNSAKSGGALYLSGSLGKVHDCLIYNNTANPTGTPLTTGRGGGIYLGDGAAPELYGNEIHNNSADYGGGVAIRWSTKPFMHDDAIYANSADTSGGGVFIQDGCSPIILKTLIVENSAPTGRALSTTASNSILNYCTLVAGPDDSVSGWLLTAQVGDATMISNSILWSSASQPAAAPILITGSEPTITYTSVFGDSVFPGLNNLNLNPQFVGTGNVWQRYTLQDTSELKDKSENGDELGAWGGSSALSWDITLAATQHPVMTYLERFVLTTNIPLMSLPYVRWEIDVPDTVGYSPADSGFAAEIAPMIYRIGKNHNEEGYPERMTITFANILGQDTSLAQEYTEASLSASGSSLAFKEELSATARSVSGTGFWGIMPEIYAEPKPVDAELLAIGQAYQVFSTVDELADGRIAFALNDDLLNGRAAANCAIARWNGEAWQVLPSQVSSDAGSISADLQQLGAYRLIWSENIRSVMLPSELELAQNYPNPFNPETVIRFAMPQAGRVKVEIFDLLGRRVITLLDAEADAGYHQLYWRGDSQYGMPAASGIYFYRLQASGKQLAKKMILIR